MKTTKELLKQNGWKEGAYDDDVDEQYYWKENVCTLVAIHIRSSLDSYPMNKMLSVLLTFCNVFYIISTYGG